LRATAQQSSEPDPIALAVIGIYRTITLFSENTLKIKVKITIKKAPRTACSGQIPGLTSLTQVIYFLPFFDSMSWEFAHFVINGNDIRIIDDITLTSYIKDKIPGNPSRPSLLLRLCRTCHNLCAEGSDYALPRFSQIILLSVPAGSGIY
jgi:hypothetical protein